MKPPQTQAQLRAQALSLGNKQKFFSRLFMAAVMFAHREGYEVVIETVYRAPNYTRFLISEGAVANVNSLHGRKLAGDISLFKDGIYLKNTEDYRFMGEYFESMGGTWGGHFDDGGHFSIEHNGVR